MLQWVWNRLMVRWVWLRPDHPIALREAGHLYAQGLPRLLRRSTNVWSLLGYAAVVHGIMFIVAVVAYHQLSNTPASGMLSVLSPFLTPFGTPIVAAVMQSILYWAMLIGLSSQVAVSFGREFHSGSWDLLRLTHYDAGEIAAAKAVAAARNWFGVMRTITILRMVAITVVPLSIVANRNRELDSISPLDVIGMAVFVLQPFAELLMAVGVSTMVSWLTPSRMWARAFSIGAVGILLGAMNGLVGLWLTFNAPMGALGAMMAPAGHWTPLVATAFPPHALTTYGIQTGVLLMCCVVIPILIGINAFRLTVRRATA